MRSYVSRVPRYRVELPCGHDFYSRTRVVALGPDGTEINWVRSNPRITHVRFEASTAVADPDLTGEEDPEDGLAFLFCDQCQRYYCLEGWELAEYQHAPRKPGRTDPETGEYRPGPRYSDHHLSLMYDAALINDEIAAWFARNWDSIAIEPAARLHHWSVDRMRDVGRDLGVFEGKARRTFGAAEPAAGDSVAA